MVVVFWVVFGGGVRRKEEESWCRLRWKVDSVGVVVRFLLLFIFVVSEDFLRFGVFVGRVLFFFFGWEFFRIRSKERYVFILFFLEVWYGNFVVSMAVGV